MFLQWQRCVSSGIDNLAASSLFLAAFCHRIYKNQPAEVFYGARSFMVPGSFFHSEACVTENKNNQLAKCFMVPRSFFHPGIRKLPYAAAARLILFFVFAERQQMPLQKKQASSGSCGGPFPEASGSPYLEGGGIRRLVAAGMPPECHHYRGWVDCSHFCGTGKVPYTAATLIYFLFLWQGNRCHR